MKKIIAEIDQSAYDALLETDREYYVKRDSDGKWIGQVEGYAPQAKVKEFRDKNIALEKQIEAFNAIGDVTHLAELAAKRADIEAGRSSSGKTVKELVEDQIGEHKKVSATALAERDAKLKQAQTELARLKIGDAALKLALPMGLQETAHDYLLFLVNGTFSLDESGRPVAKTADGSPIYGRNAEPLELKEFLEGHVEKTPLLWHGSNGSGASNGRGGPASKASGVNPFKKETYNLTEQGRIEVADPALYKRLKAEAGVR